jgi:hypothetical protein
VAAAGRITCRCGNKQVGGAGVEIDGELLRLVVFSVRVATCGIGEEHTGVPTVIGPKRVLEIQLIVEHNTHTLPELLVLISESVMTHVALSLRRRRWMALTSVLFKVIKSTMDFAAVKVNDMLKETESHSRHRSGHLSPEDVEIQRPVVSI